LIGLILDINSVS